MSINTVEIISNTDLNYSQSIFIAFDNANNNVNLSSFVEYKNSKMSCIHTLAPDDVDKLISALQIMKKEFK